MSQPSNFELLNFYLQFMLIICVCTPVPFISIPIIHTLGRLVKFHVNKSFMSTENIKYVYAHRSGTFDTRQNYTEKKVKLFILMEMCTIFPCRYILRMTKSVYFARLCIHQYRIVFVQIARVYSYTKVLKSVSVQH